MVRRRGSCVVGRIGRGLEAVCLWGWRLARANGLRRVRERLNPMGIECEIVEVWELGSRSQYRLPYATDMN